MKKHLVPFEVISFLAYLVALSVVLNQDEALREFPIPFAAISFSGAIASIFLWERFHGKQGMLDVPPHTFLYASLPVTLLIFHLFVLTMHAARHF